MSVEDDFTPADLAKVGRKELSSQSSMPFGKYKGWAIGKVPARYLLWWADESPTHNLELLAYILENRSDLEDQAEEECHDYDHYS